MEWEQQWKPEKNCYLLFFPEHRAGSLCVSPYTLPISNLTFCTLSYIPHVFMTPRFTFNSPICNKAPQGMQSEAPVPEAIQLSAMSVTKIQVNDKGNLDKMRDMNMEMMMMDSE